jgi:hypothetical protein
LFFDESGNVYANNYYIGVSSLADLFAPIAHVSIYATSSAYGHVLLSDTPDVNNDTTTHIAATPKAVSDGITSANQYA